MAGKIPRFNTAPAPKERADFAEAKPKAHIPSFATAPAAGPVVALTDLFTRRAEAEKQRGKPEAAAVELQRAQTCQRVRFNLKDICINDDLETVEEQPGQLQRFLTTIKTAARTATGKRPRKSEIVETEEKKLLREFRAHGLRAVDFPTFKKLFKDCGEGFAKRLFDYLDRDGAGFALDEEIVSVLVALQKGSMDEKLAFLWSFISSHSDRITRTELQELVRASATGGKFSLSDEAVASLASAFFVQAGVTDASYLTQEQFKNVLLSRTDLLDTLAMASLKPSKAAMEKMKNRGCCGFNSQVMTLPWWSRTSAVFAEQFKIDDFPMFVFLTVVILAEIAGFVVGFLQNDHGGLFGPLGWSYPVAKGAARSVQVVLIVFPFTVARTLITHLRSTFLASVLPLNEHLKVHGHLALHFFVWGLAHSIAHFINGTRIDKPSRFLSSAPPPQRDPRATLLNRNLSTGTGLPPAPPPLGPDYHWYRRETQVTGVLLFGIMVLGFGFVLFKDLHERAQRKKSQKRLPDERAKCKKWQDKLFLDYLNVMAVVGSFEAFYYTHIFMAISMLVLLIIHPYPYVHERPHRSTTWLYLLAGTAIYLLERILRMSKQLLWRTKLIDIRLHPAQGRENVTELRLSVPVWAFQGSRSFNYRPGQYAFINVPAISRFEWHPFSLSSAPTDDFLSFHIQAAGDWTRSLYALCMRTLQDSSVEMNGKTISTITEEGEGAGADTDIMDTKQLSKLDLLPPMKRNFFSVRIDGPFGAPAQDYRKYKTLLMVGGGIGATPFASVLRELVSEFNAAKCWNCACANTKLFGVRKAYFYWATNQQHHTAALRTTLEEIQKADVQNFLEIYVHYTQAKTDDFQTMLARVAHALQHEQGGKDAFLGVDSTLPCFFGRPDWIKVLTKVALENPSGSDVGVFVCGKTPLVNEITAACAKFNEPGSTDVVNPSGTIFKLNREVF